MTEKQRRIEELKGDFKEIQPALTVLGDETRQLIFLVLMETDCKTGMRVGEITEKTNLSRPAVSHQMKILKDLGIVKMRKEGTKNFYYIDVSHNRILFGKMGKMVMDLNHFMSTMEEQ